MRISDDELDVRPESNAERCSGKEFAKWKINCRYYSPRSHCMTVIMRHASCALVTMAVVSLVIVAIVNNRTLKKR
jgi:hypothetical protein